MESARACGAEEENDMKFSIIPGIVAGISVVALTGCLDMSMPQVEGNSVAKCPATYGKHLGTECPDDEGCLTLDDGTICVKYKVVIGGGNGPNCAAGYVTVSDSELGHCREDKPDEDPNDGTYYCELGNLGRYCRKVPDESPESLIVAHEGQTCLEYQLSDNPDTLRIHVIDVGQGDAIWIQTPTGQNVLVDAGDAGYMGKTAAGPIIADYLAFHDFPEGSTFDAVVLTHPHSDHFGGMAYLFGSRYNVNYYIDPMELDTKENVPNSYKDWISTVKRRVAAENIYMPAEEKFKAGEEMPNLFFGPNIKAEYFTSSKTLLSNNNNSASIVFKITYAGRSFLFTGDAEAAQELKAVQAGKDGVTVASNFLKVCHHGSETSSSPAFLNAVWPDSVPEAERAAFISSGRYEFSGTTLPRESIVNALLKYIPVTNLYSTNAGDNDKDEDDAIRDDNILIVVKSDGSYYSCYSGVN